MFVRRFILLAVVTLVACHPNCWAADDREEVKAITVSSSVSLEKGLSELIEQIRSNQRATPKDCTRLRLFIHQLEGGKLNAAAPDKRQQIVRDVLGAGRYKSVEDLLFAQMKLADTVLRECAIRTLGQVLYSASSEDYLKGVVFGPDRQARFFALTSLAALGTPGANDLLTVMLLSGTLTDPMAGDAIDVLLLSDKSTLVDIGQAVISANKGPLAVKALLPALRLRKDFREIVATLFRSDIGRVPDEERLTLIDHAKLNLEYDLLEEISQNVATYSNDKTVRQKVAEYAKSMAHSEIYTLALLALERSGEDMAYFERMLEDKTLPKEKVNVLNLIINRIRRGQRLGTSVAGSVKQTTSSDANKPKEEVLNVGGQSPTNSHSSPSRRDRPLSKP